ncbi:MAG TPA: TMEM175 family protein [Xanthobacteraceae bacterium]|nr:TMEM175 family protein [Xanthobacteraceae bacterium]
MSATKQEILRAAKPQKDSPWPHVRLSETDRLETFSDSVLSITITLLVAEIVRPEYASGQLLEKLTVQWASYIAFLASFFYAGVIWLNHRAVFARVRYCDRSLHLANLFLLLTSALIPFPTAVLSAAVQSGNEFDARVAVTLYAGIAGSMCLAWLIVFHVLSIHSYLLEDDIDPAFFPKERFRAALGVVLYAIAGVAGWLWTPQLAMLIFLALPVFYGITSEGLTETRLRLQFGKAHRNALAKADHDRLRAE